MVEMGGFEPPCAVCAPVSLTHGCSCRELQNAITTLPHLHEGGAGLSRLSPLRVGCLRLAPIGTRFCFLLVLYPRKPVPACTSPEHWIWCRRQDSNLRLSELALYATIRPSSTAEVHLH